MKLPTFGLRRLICVGGLFIEDLICTQTSRCRVRAETVAIRLECFRKNVCMFQLPTPNHPHTRLLSLSPHSLVGDDAGFARGVLPEVAIGSWACECCNVGVVL